MRVTWWLVLAVLRTVCGDSDWANCPSICSCKWSSGKKVADCEGKKLTTVPDQLSPEMQSIDLSNNEIYSLPSEAFRAVGLVNLHKIYLRECQIQDLHKDAFKGLQILIELDLSHNKIHMIHPSTFHDNPRLRVLTLHHNPITKLEDDLFKNMIYLQIVDLHDCQLARISPKTFFNVSALSKLLLHGNNLAHMRVDVVEPLEKLADLEIQDNPWRCDCHLRPFRDWALSRNLIANKPTACVQPPHLANKLWKDVSSMDFACKPQIVYPPAGKPLTIEASGEDATLSCKVTGDPEPEVYWVINSRIISNVTRSNYGDSRYTVHYEGGWVNLTVGRVRAQDRGELTCVAKSPGGVDERNVTLAVREGNPTSVDRAAENWPLILGLVTGLMACLVVCGVLCCCLCQRRRPPSPAKTDAPNGDITHPEKSLLTVVNPVQKPPRRYDERPTEIAELNRNLLDETGTSVSQEYEEPVASTPNPGEAPHYPPDLLAFSRGLSTPPHLTSPLHGTLPYSRSQSPFSPTRPGYVTIPRRPRVPSWSSAPTPTLLEDPLALFKLEPTYDNLGPRTTADGSSVLSLNKSGSEVQPRPRPMPQHCSTLPTPRRPRAITDGSPLPRTTSVEGPLSPSKPKVPPKPPPKPKKNGPLYEDEGEDGTEV